MLASLPKVPKM